MAFLTPRHPEARRGARHLDTRRAPLMLQQRQGCDGSFTKASAKLVAHGGPAFPGVPPPREAGGARSSTGCLRQQIRSGALSMSITITAERRQFLYTYLELTLYPGWVKELWREVDAGRFDAADRIASECSDALCLIANDLRWGKAHGGDIELTSSPDVLRRIFTRLLDIAMGERPDDAIEPDEWQDWSHRLEDICLDVLAGLDREEGTGPARRRARLPLRRALGRLKHPFARRAEKSRAHIQPGPPQEMGQTGTQSVPAHAAEKENLFDIDAAIELAVLLALEQKFPKGVATFPELLRALFGEETTDDDEFAIERAVMALRRGHILGVAEDKVFLPRRWKPDCERRA